MTAVLMLLGGAVLLYFGAEWLVGGASRLALSLRIPQLIVGLSVVAFGTSAPEIIVSVEAALAGHGAVALGNVLGSNIANLGLVLGISVLVRPARVAGELRGRELPVLFASTVALAAILVDGVVAGWEAALLLVAAFAYTAWTIRAARSGAVVAEARAATEVTAGAADAGGAPAPDGRARQAVVAAVGLGVLLLGGKLFVDGATAVAYAIGMSERVVGLTIVAVGTSLPELATSLIAAARGHSEIAIGNVVGSNIYNVLLCLGAAGLAGNIATPPETVLLDLAVLGVMTLLGLVFLRTARVLQRWEGLVLVLCYAAFIAWLVVA
jgi:cation:H+ antiporter